MGKQSTNQADSTFILLGQIMSTKLQSDVCYLTSQCKMNQKLDITEHLLSVPYSQRKSLSRKEDIHCKEALFDFLASIDKRI